MATFKDSFQGRLAVITGGSSGIGYALAKLLSEAGARVWLLAQRKEGLDSSFQILFGANGKDHGKLAVDVSKWNQVQATLERFQRDVGVPDLLINSAGITEPGYVEEIPVETYRALMETNYLGTVHATKAVLPGMLKRGSGHIVNIASSAAFVTGPGYAAYSPSKYAVRGFSDALRAEVKPRGVKVSLVYPPNTDTPQRAYEVSRQTPELHHLDENAGLGPWKFGTVSADYVAEEILKGMQRGKYVILPGTGNRLLYRIVSLLGDYTYSIVDDEWKAARKKYSKT